MDSNDRLESIISDVRERTGREKTVNVDEEQLKFVIFSLLGNKYAFSGNHVKEILVKQEIAYVPGAPRQILGIINIRGDIESVISINRMMSMPDSQSTGAERIIMAKSDGIKSGILVDSVLDVLDIERGSIYPPLATHGDDVREIVTGTLILGADNITILDVSKLFKKIAG